MTVGDEDEEEVFRRSVVIR